MKRWTEEEIAYLKAHSNESEEFLTSYFEDRTWKSIKHKIINMGFPRDKQYNRYSKEEDEIIKNNSHLPVSETQKLLSDRTLESIIQRYNYLGIEWNKTWDFWSEEDIEILMEFDDIDDMMELLPNKTRNSVYLKASKLGKKFLKSWTEEEDNILRDNYSKIHVAEYIHLLPSRNERAIYIRANRLGLNGVMGKGGVTPINKMARLSKEYKFWRESVFLKDDYTCKKCNSRGGKIQAHHIFPFSCYVDLRYTVSNGITLCKNCHDVTCEGSFHNIYGTYNNTKEQLEEFLGIKIEFEYKM